jgi:indolepyruvate ferredoxin oxidoreductase beta subunit
MSVEMRPITILIAALGGEGGGVLAEWLVALANAAGHPVQSTSIPGVAQRTGATTYYVEVWPQPASALGGRHPVLSLLPVPGGIDLAIASELLEAARVVQSGMVSPDRTVMIASLGRTLTTAEKMALSDGRVDSGLLRDVVRGQSRQFHAFDMGREAEAAGTVVSAVMFGAIAGSRVLPFARDAFEAVIRGSGRGASASLAGFARGFAEVATPLAPAPAASDKVESAPPPESAIRAAAGFPATTRAIIATGSARQIEFQDAAYADLYRERLARVLAAETASDPAGLHGHALTRETARFLALWMAYDDVIRVAYLKCRAHRFARVRREVAADAADVVRIVDYFGPGAEEIGSLLPAALARRLDAWDRRRQARGEAPLAFSLHLRTDSISGFAALRLLAGLRVVRRHGSRYRDEQAAIERWLAAVEAAAAESWQCAHEIALCGRLVKGYGATNKRGKANLAHILEHLAKAPVGADLRAAAIREARDAALADEGGRRLDAALIRHGAPPRAIEARPVAFVPRRAPSPRRADTTA